MHEIQGADPWIAEAALKNRIKHFVIDGEAVVLVLMASATLTPCIPAGAALLLRRAGNGWRRFTPISSFG